MPLFTVRSERSCDVAAIDAITREAFADHPWSHQTEHLIVNALRHAGALSVSLVAEAQDSGAVIGHVAVSPVRVAGESLRWYGLGPVSVAVARQGQGVGSALVRAALAELQAQGAAGCVLLGDAGFYRRFGFNQDARLVLPCVPAEHFMALAWRLPVPAGDVSYHPAFSAGA